MSAHNVEEIIRSVFANQKHIVSVILFGSFATGKQTPKSDVDIAVLYDYSCVPSQWDLLDLKETISGNIGRDVDLVCLNTANPIIAMQVYKSGKVIINNNQHLGCDSGVSVNFNQ